MFFVLYGGLLSLALATVAVIAARAYDTCVRRAVDVAALQHALRARALTPGALHAIAAALPSTWAAELLAAALRELDPVEPDARALDECTAQLETRAQRGIMFLQTVARAAPLLAFMIAIVELGVAFRHDAGLLSLQKGLAETIAISHAALAVLTGMSLSVAARGGAAFLRRHAARERNDTARIAALLERARSTA